MQHIPDTGRVLLRAYSVRLWAASSAIIILVEPLVGLLVEVSDSWNFYLRLALRLFAGILGLLGIWARVIKQKEFEDEQD